MCENDERTEIPSENWGSDPQPPAPVPATTNPREEPAPQGRPVVVYDVDDLHVK